MGEIIIKNAVKRESGFLYYIDGEGNLCQAKLMRAGRQDKKFRNYDEPMDEYRS